MDQIRWLLLDVGGVLEVTDDDVWPTAYAERWATRLDLSLEDYLVRIGAADLPDASRRDDVEEEFWRRYGDAVGASADQLVDMRADFWNAYCGEPNHPLFDLVRSLVGRVGLALLSNSGDGARREEERRFGFSELFDPICYSHEMGVTKPDLAAYHLALTAMGVEPGEVLFVDNEPANVAAAGALGMRTHLHEETPATIETIRAALGEQSPGS